MRCWPRWRGCWRAMEKTVHVAGAVAGWFPVVFAYSILAFAYYGYVVSILVTVVSPQSIAAAAILGVIFHVLWFMALISYTRATFTKPGTAPEHFKMDPAERDRMAAVPVDELPAYLDARLGPNTPLIVRGADRRPRYCDHCHTIKPDRCHHCSMCGRCVARMDHHCVWINNCVGLHTHKYFFLMVSYGVALAVWILVSGVPFALQAAGDPDRTVEAADTTVWLLMGVLAGMFTAALTLFMVQHLRIILHNRTQVEQTIRMEPPDSRWIFDVGRSANWRQFMGPRWWEWLLPIPPKANLDGVRYPTYVGDLEEAADTAPLLTTTPPGPPVQTAPQH